MKLFRPLKAATVNISVSASSQRVKIANTNGIVQIRVANLGTAPAWIGFGDSTVTASATADIPIPAGYVGGFTIEAPTTDALYAAAIAAGSTGSIYFTIGTGI